MNTTYPPPPPMRHVLVSRRSFSFVLPTLLGAVLIGLSGSPAARADYASAVKTSDPVVYYQFDTVNESGNQVQHQDSSADGPSAVAIQAVSQKTAVLLSGAAGPRPTGGFGGFSAENKTASFIGAGASNQQFLFDGEASGGALHAALAGQSGTTIEFWINPTAQPTDTNMGLFMKPQQSGGKGISIAYTSTGFLLGANPSQTSFQSLPFAADIQTDTWYHVAAVFDYAQAEMSLYVDGVLIETQDATGWKSSTLNLTNPNNYYTLIGQWGTLANFEGSLDEFAIYNRTLSAEEIAGHYAASQIPESAAWSLIGAGFIFSLVVSRRVRSNR